MGTEESEVSSIEVVPWREFARELRQRPKDSLKVQTKARLVGRSQTEGFVSTKRGISQAGSGVEVLIGVRSKGEMEELG